MNPSPAQTRVALELIESAAKDITTANGYHTDAGLRVAFNRTTASGELPCIHINPGAMEATDQGKGNGQARWLRDITIEALADDADDRLLGEDLLDDLITAIAKVITQVWAAQVAQRVIYTGANVAKREDGGATVGAELTLQIQFDTRAPAQQ